VFYYRAPALSVLWPVFEFTDDHTAVRPFFSVYGLDQTNRQYSVLWPLTQFDRQTREHWIFPVFWGNDYEVVFPLYSHERDAAGSHFYSLLWLSGADTNGDSWRSLPPLFYQASNATSSVFATPVWAQGRSESKDWRALIPLVYWDRQQRTMISPLWARWISFRRTRHPPPRTAASSGAFRFAGTRTIAA
jgi:hypothetical protein